MERSDMFRHILKEKKHEALKNFLDDIYEYVVEADAAKDEANARVATWNKDEELQKLKSEIELLRKEHWQSFAISPAEQEAIKAWKAAHIKESPKCGGHHGAIGGNWTYEFVPTSIGDIGTIKCSCGAEFTFKELC